MPIPVASNLTPANGQTFYLVEDTFLKGGLQIRDSITERDAIPIQNLKVGALVLTHDTGTIWQVSELVLPTIQNPNTIPSATWEEFQVGGGFDDAPSDGKFYARKDGEWVALNASSGTIRTVFIKTIDELNPGDIVDFDHEIGATVIAHKIEVSRPVLLSAFSTADRDEVNPYRFLATSDHLVDDGTMLLQDDTVLKLRNFSIYTNLEDPVNNTIYFRIESVDEVPGPVTMTLGLIVIQSV
jgi:hypothetical protein